MDCFPEIIVFSGGRGVPGILRNWEHPVPFRSVVWKQLAQFGRSDVISRAFLVSFSSSIAFLKWKNSREDLDRSAVCAFLYSSRKLSCREKAGLYEEGYKFIADSSAGRVQLKKMLWEALVSLNHALLSRYLLDCFDAEVDKLNHHILNQNDFLQMAVHDLRSPLSAMICYSELLMDGVLGNISGEGLESIKIIHQNCQFLINMVNDLLDSAQLEAGKKSLKLVRANLNVLIRKVVRSLQGLAKAKDILINALLEDIPDIFIDPEKMERIIINLLGNAIKFTKSGGVIDIHCQRKGNHIIFSIQDTGPGIHQNDIKKIFKKFNIGDESRISGKGHGLGLVITKSFVEMHGGKIFVKSERHKGSTFIIHLCVEKRLEPVSRKQDKEVIILDYASDMDELNGLRKIGNLGVRYFQGDENWAPKARRINCAGLIINAGRESGYLSPSAVRFLVQYRKKYTPCVILVPETGSVEEWARFQRFNLEFLRKPVAFSRLMNRMNRLAGSDRRREN